MGSTGTILLVDDSPDDLQLLTRTFDQLGIQNPVETCSSADEAIGVFGNAAAPDRNVARSEDAGPRWLLRPAPGQSNPVWKDLVVIVLTMSSDIYDIRLAYELGANSFLTKPVNLSEFKDKIRAFHKYWIVRAQPAPPHPRVISIDVSAA